MINRDEAVAITTAARTIRPKWDPLTAINTLLTIDADFPDLMAHALRVAADPDNRTPVALTFTPVTTHGAPTAGKDTGPKCVICGRSRRMCEFVRTKEIRLGLPDPHWFEEPDRPDAPHPGGVSVARAVMPAVNRLPELPYVPADLATEAAAPIPPEPDDQADTDSQA